MIKRLMTFLVCAVALAGCTTVSQLDAASKNRITFVIDGHNFDDIWDAAHRALTDDLKIVAENRISGYIKATSEADVATFSAGEAVGIFISLMDEKSSRYWIAVVSEPLYQPVYISRDWHLGVAKRMKSALGEPSGPAG
ncbi:MAG: hypothetical protein HQ511_07270 [Rhodospirillales bacterium]|nr:hypothetical protein [Rhodospirillales bacterium]